MSLNNPTPAEGISGEKKNHEIIAQGKINLQRRLDRNNFKGAGKPIFAGVDIHYEMAERTRPENVKERLVREKEWRNIRLKCEDVAEFDYRPTACEKTYRMVVVGKNLSVEEGENMLFDDVRYFFYITDISSASKSKAEIVFEANQRCNQENLFAQFKSGMNAMRMPTSDLLSNWAYLAIATLAWSLKAWYGQLIPDLKTSRKVIRMEFKKFLYGFVMLPCQILKRSRRLVYRMLCHRETLTTFFQTHEVIRRLQFE